MNNNILIAGVGGVLGRELVDAFIQKGIRPFSFQYFALGKMLVFFSVTRIPTESRGKTDLGRYLQRYYARKG
ncbi:MAG: hypothetical protein HQL22_04665 [Candidatus Omnitrophica bacterium]|nr:hypothetical protein [Candidatus Omnitrophota bacterium]